MILASRNRCVSELRLARIIETTARLDSLALFPARVGALTHGNRRPPPPKKNPAPVSAVSRGFGMGHRGDRGIRKVRNHTEAECGGNHPIGDFASR